MAIVSITITKDTNASAEQKTKELDGRDSIVIAQRRYTLNRRAKNDTGRNNKKFEQEIDEFEGLKKIHAVTHEDYEYIEKARQLAEWLKELERADTLLKATYDLLNKQHGNYYVLNLLAETVHYDGAECDGNCLMEDIDAWMDERGIDYDTTRD